LFTADYVRQITINSRTPFVRMLSSVIGGPIGALGCCLPAETSTPAAAIKSLNQFDGDMGNSEIAPDQTAVLPAVTLAGLALDFQIRFQLFGDAWSTVRPIVNLEADLSQLTFC
jgi:hypothetical protein